MAKKKSPLCAVLLAGGSGTRLWPVSREFYPKQLVKFFGGLSLIQHTIKRLFPIFQPDDIRIVCGNIHANKMKQEMEGIGVTSEGKIIIESCGRNTAPAILLAVLELIEQSHDPVIVVFAADHAINDVAEFHRKIQSAVSLAEQNFIVTFGIQPNYPETGYGYIEAARTPCGDGYRIKRFVEKPDLSIAQTYLESGNFYWNSGMFAFKASVILNEFQTLKPEMLSRMQSLLNNAPVIPESDYKTIESISIDYAIMEHTEKGVVLPSDFGWSDIGSWKSLYDFLPKNSEGSVIIPGTDVIIHNTRNSFIMGQERLIAVNSIQNLVVVDTDDALFISDMETSRDVKHIVDGLNAKNRRESQLHVSEKKSWGIEKILEETETVILKKIIIYSGRTVAFRCSEGHPRELFISKGAGRLHIPHKSEPVEIIGSVFVATDDAYAIENLNQEELHLIEMTRIR